MTLTDFVQRLTRHLQGERPGMRAIAGRAKDLHAARLPKEISALPTIRTETTVRLADVSFWQEEIDFAVMKAAGLAGVIIRAGQRSWVDSRFKENWRKARAAGMPRGSYWFYDSRDEPKKQAALWWSLIRDDPGELVHVADLEESYGGPYGSKAHMKEFLIEFQRLSGLDNNRIAIYTGYFWWVERVGNDSFFKLFPVWIAWYAAMSLVRVPAPWVESDLLFWQYTASGNGTAYGVSSQEIDLNYYCCDQATFNHRFALGSIEPPSEGDPMPDYLFSITPTNTTGSKIRPEPDTGNTPYSNLGLPYGKRAYGNKKIQITQEKWEAIGGINQRVNAAGDIWLEVLEVDGVVLSQPAYIAEIHLGTRYARIEQLSTPTEPPADGTPLPDLPVTITLGDDVTYAKQTVSITLKAKS